VTGRLTFEAPDNYDWCPIPVTPAPLTGSSYRDVDESVAWLFGRVTTWSSVLHLPPQQLIPGAFGVETVGIRYDTEALATNRAGEPLALRTRFELYETFLDSSFRTRPKLDTKHVGGWAYFLPVHSPWRAEELAREILTRFLERTGSAPVPSWLTDELMPATDDEDAKLEDLHRQEAEVAAAIDALTERRVSLRRIVGLLYESGQALEDLVADALGELGIALAEPIGNEEYLALHEGVLAAVEAKGNSKSASGDDYRAIMDHVTQLAVSGIEARGILVVCAWRNDPPDSRRDWFPDNVARTARDQGRVSLVRSVDLLRAVLAKRRGDDLGADDFARALFSVAGLVSLP
jgi:hypothetical protein